MIVSRRMALAALALSTTLGFSAQSALAQNAEKPKVTLGVGGKLLLYYLPLTVAEKKGFFKEQGLDVEINDFGGGAKSLQALIGGSVDVVTGAYEHTIRMQAKGQDVRAVVELGRFPGITISVRKDLADKVKSAADFKGLKIGVTAPGSSTSLTAQYAMVKAGLKATDAAIIGVGAGASAVAAMKNKQVDIISHLDPVTSKLEADGDVVALIDTRTEAGTRAVFGGSNPRGGALSQGRFRGEEPDHHAEAGQCLRQVAEVAGDGQARGCRRSGAGRVPSRRQAALSAGREKLAGELFAHRRLDARGAAEHV